MTPVKISVTLQRRLSGHYAPLVTPWHAFLMSTTLQHAKHPIPCVPFPFAGRLRFFFLPLPGRAAISSCLKPINLYENFRPLLEGTLWMIWKWAHFIFVRSFFCDISPGGSQILGFGGASLFCLNLFKLQGLHIDFSFIMKHGVGSV